MPDVNPHASTSLDVGPGATHVRWQVFGLSCAASWMLYLHRYAFALFKPALAKEWDVDLVDLGTMDSMFYASYLVFQVPTGLAADFFGTRLFLGSIIIAWSMCLALHALVPGRWSMYGVRLLFGMTQAGAYPTLSKVTKAWFPLSIRTSLQGWIASFFGRSGGASANVLFAALMLGLIGLPWRTAIAILAVAGVALGVAVLVVLRNTPQEHPRVNDAERRLIAEVSVDGAPAANTVFPSPCPLPPGERDDSGTSPSLSDRAPVEREAGASPPSPCPLPPGERVFWRRISARSARNMGFFLTQGFAATFADALYVTWLPYFLSVERELNAIWMGLISSMPLVGGACGGVFGGYCNDFLLRTLPSRRWARSLVGSLGMGMACLLVFAALAVYENPYAFCSVLMCSKFFSDWSQPTVWGTVTDIAGRNTATVFGLVNGVGGIGALVAPAVLGAIAQYQSWHAAFVLIGAIYALGAAAWLMVNCTVTLINES